MDDLTDRPHNLVPSYLDQCSFDAPKNWTIQNEHDDQITPEQQWTTKFLDDRKIFESSIRQFDTAAVDEDG